jgi:GxxExxY protein
MERQDEVARVVVKAFYAVYETMGYGFLEKVYENALTLELRRRGLVVQPQCPIKVYYLGELVGEYFADLLVDECLIVEIRAVEALTASHEAQLLNYLKATRFDLGLLLNFGPKPEVKRKIFETARASP